LEENRKQETPITSTLTSDKDNGDINPETRDSLPSKTDERRWQASKRMSRMMDTLLARASIAGQHINVYTGTDYSGIEELKKKIVNQEEKVRGCHKIIDSTRAANHEAHEQQDASQKEIVALLERKSSWSPDELERYMSLVRSEHANEQAVQAAKENLTVAEKELEDARARLERLERRQYHEEQIWSDTIRRNSTWVTFGLMGVNIILLLAQIAIFEPYRRKKIVKEVQKALDEMNSASQAVQVERQIDEVVEPKGASVELIEKSEPSLDAPKQPLDAFVPSKVDAGKTPLAAGEVLPEEATQLTGIPPPTPSSTPAYPATWAGTWDAYKDSFQDLFSERIVQLKKVDITTIALQGAATGVAAMGIIFVVFRPR
jgi:sensitive to high expression protein 9